jgi:quaternary ammonium compound-resistance protein SugE
MTGEGASEVINQPAPVFCIHIPVFATRLAIQSSLKDGWRSGARAVGRRIRDECGSLEGSRGSAPPPPRRARAEDLRGRRETKEACVAWVWLFLAGLLEIGWAVGLKLSEGFTRLWPSVWTIVAMAASLGLLGLALKTLPVGTAYAIWTGIGAVGTAAFGMLVLGEPATAARIGGIALIAAGIATLKAAG